MGGAQQTNEARGGVPGSTLGRYELLVPIAAGGMARVWAARLVGQGGFRKVVALKMILPDFAEHLHFQAMFHDEARIAAKLHHPNVCETFDLGEENGTLFLTMEWVDGPSLLQLTKGPEKASRRAIDPRVAARIVADACAGLHAAHELLDDDGTPLNVVHRDVSPHNILVSSAGIVKVTDFGVAKARGKSHMTAAGEIKGKVSYMAPEQLLASESLDARCDVFALGCVLYEISTGRRAFSGANEGEIVSAILTGTVTRPSEHDPTYPPALEQIVLRALMREPGDRHASAAALRDELEAFLASSGPQVTSSAVAALVLARFGAEIEKTREQIRAACAGRLLTSGPGHSMQPRSPSTPDRSENGIAVVGDAAEAPTPPRASGRSDAVAAAAAALAIAALVLGGAVWFAVARARSPLASASPSQPPVGLVSLPASIAPHASAPLARNESARSPRVTFRLTPSNASLVVDGVVMPPGVDAVQRPIDGKPLTVVVRADKHEDRSVTIDAAVPDTIDVVLLPRASVVKPPVRQGPSKPAASAPTTAEALPNPYE